MFFSLPPGSTKCNYLICQGYPMLLAQRKLHSPTWDSNGPAHPNTRNLSIIPCIQIITPKLEPSIVKVQHYCISTRILTVNSPLSLSTITFSHWEDISPYLDTEVVSGHKVLSHGIELGHFVNDSPPPSLSCSVQGVSTLHWDKTNLHSGY